MNTDLIKKIDNLYYYQTDEFSSILIKHFFTFENTPKNYVIATILADYMEQTNLIYKTSKKISDMEKSLYGSLFSIIKENRGTKNIISFSLKMIDHKIIDEDFFKDAIKYFKNMMLKPNFRDNQLDKSTLNQIKKDFLDKKKNNEKAPANFRITLFYRNMLPGSDFNYNRLYSEEIEKILDEISDQDIIDFYHNLMNNYVASYAFGNLNIEEIKHIAKTFKFKPIAFDYQYDFKENLRNDYKVINSKDTTQSYLYVVYEIKDYKKENSYIYHSMIPLFNGFNGLCHVILRDKLGLVYQSYSDFLLNRGLFLICAHIDKKNIDKTLSGIDEIMEEIKNEDTINRLLNFSKERFNQDFYTGTESPNFYLTSIERYILKDEYIQKDLVDKINSLTTDDILKQLSNFEKKYIFLYEGDKDEK